MNHEAAALLQDAEALAEQGLTVAWNVVVDIIAGHKVKALVREGEFPRVGAEKVHIFDALGAGVIFAELLAKGSVLPPPAVRADKACLRISLGSGYGERAASAAYVQSPAARGNFDLRCDPVYDVLREFTLSLVGEDAVEHQQVGGT